MISDVMISSAAVQNPRNGQGVTCASILGAMNTAALAMPAAERSGAPETLWPGWKSVVLVCKACEKRSKGPKKITAKEVARHLKKAAHEARVPRPRVVMTSCLGACPKKAFTVAAASPDGAIAMVAFRRGDDAAAAVGVLLSSATHLPTPATVGPV